MKTEDADVAQLLEELALIRRRGSDPRDALPRLRRLAQLGEVDTVREWAYRWMDVTELRHEEAMIVAVRRTATHDELLIGIGESVFVESGSGFEPGCWISVPFRSQPLRWAATEALGYLV